MHMSIKSLENIIVNIQLTNLYILYAVHEVSFKSLLKVNKVN